VSLNVRLPVNFEIVGHLNAIRLQQLEQGFQLIVMGRLEFLQHIQKLSDLMEVVNG